MNAFKTSRYNFSFPTNAGTLLYNSLSGKSRLLEGEDSSALAKSVCEFPASTDVSSFPDALLGPFLESGFLVDENFDELAVVRERFQTGREKASVALTVTLTQDCNLGCYYCYQDRQGSFLNDSDLRPLLKHAEERLINSDTDKLHVDWYGGEPMLNVEFLELASTELQKMCTRLGVEYEASMLSNGTMWPADKAQFVQRHKLVRLQVSFDGMELKHNKTRRKRREYHESCANQFLEAVEVVDALHKLIWVDVRFNISAINCGEAIEFARSGKDRGWFDGTSKAKLQLAKITAYTDRIDFLRENGLEYAEFESVRDAVRTIVKDTFLDTTSAVTEYPRPRESVCSAIANNSIVIGAEGKLYNCGLQIGDVRRSVGDLHQTSSTIQRKVIWLTDSLNMNSEQHDLSVSDSDFWNSFNPADMPNCKSCSFLPLCWGACPKLHLENDKYHLHQQSEYWRKMLPKRLSASTGLDIDSEFELTHDDQFR